MLKRSRFHKHEESANRTQSCIDNSWNKVYFEKKLCVCNHQKLKLLVKTKSREKVDKTYSHFFQLHLFFYFKNFYFAFKILLLKNIQLNLWQIIYEKVFYLNYFFKGMHLAEIKNKFSEFCLFYTYLIQKCKIITNYRRITKMLQKLRNK